MIFFIIHITSFIIGSILLFVTNSHMIALNESYSHFKEIGNIDNRDKYTKIVMHILVMASIALFEGNILSLFTLSCILSPTLKSIFQLIVFSIALYVIIGYAILWLFCFKNIRSHIYFIFTYIISILSYTCLDYVLLFIIYKLEF